MVSFAIDTLMFGCGAVCCDMVFLAAVSTFLFPLTECRSMPEAVAFIALIQVPLRCIALDFMLKAVDDKASLDTLIGGILVFRVKFLESSV